MSRGNISLDDIRELSFYIQSANRSIENADRELSRSKSKSKTMMKSFDVINEDTTNISSEANPFVRKVNTVKTKKKNSVLNVTSPSSNLSKATEETEYAKKIKHNTQMKKKPIKLLYEKFQIPSSTTKPKKSISRNLYNTTFNNTFKSSFNSNMTNHQKTYSLINQFTYKDINHKEKKGLTKKSITGTKEKKINFVQLINYKGMKHNDINELYEMFMMLNKLTVPNANIKELNNEIKETHKIKLIQREWRKYYIRSKMVNKYDKPNTSNILLLSKMEFFNYLVNNDKNFKELINTMNKANELYQKCLKSKTFCDMKNVIISNRLFSIVNTHLRINKRSIILNK